MTIKQIKRIKQIEARMRNYETKQLVLKVQRLLREVNAILAEDFGREILRVREMQGYQLLTLLAWSERYRVPLRYILHATVPFYIARISNRFARHARSLGFRVATLVCKKSEQRLQDQIRIDFPNSENITQWNWERQQAIIRSRTEDPEFPPAGLKPLLAYATVKEYVRRYTAKIESRKKVFDKEYIKPSNRRRAYRGNPWL